VIAGARIRGFGSGIRVAGGRFPEDLSSFAESEGLRGIAALPSGNNLVFRDDSSGVRRCRRCLGIARLALMRRIWEMP
jgi:hypothetical protein